MKDKEELEKPPSVDLPHGYSWEKRHGGWTIERPHWALGAWGLDLQLARAIVAAADELEARKAR